MFYFIEILQTTREEQKVHFFAYQKACFLHLKQFASLSPPKA